LRGEEREGGGAFAFPAPIPQAPRRRACARPSPALDNGARRLLRSAVNQHAPIAATAQLPPLQRAAGVAAITVKADPHTRLDRLYQDGCAKIRLPTDPAATGLEAVLINTAGGLTGGDRLAWTATAGEGAALTLTTQACEKIYRARDGRAQVATTLTAGPAARIDWLPQETILFDGAALARTLTADLAQDATLLAVEAVILGRTAMGETLRWGQLRDRWRIRREGRLIFADDFALAGPIAAIAAQPPVLAGAAAFATLLLAAPDAERFLAPLRQILGPAAGASVFDGKLVCRIVAPDGLTLRRTLIPALQLLRRGRPCPRVWRL
jgi:urease accessory protein